MSREAYFQAKRIIPETRQAIAYRIKRIVDESRKRRAVNRVLGPIGEKLAAEWLKNDDYEVYRFAQLIWMFTEMRIAKKSRRKIWKSKRGRAYLNEISAFLGSTFGDKIEPMVRLEEAITPARVRAPTALDIQLPDLLAKKNSEVFFFEIKTNTAHLSKSQKTFFDMARAHGFETKTIRVNLEFDVAFA